MNKLTDRIIRLFIADGETGRKFFDGGGLYLVLTPAGTPVFRLKFKHNGKERVYAIGPYPEFTLAAARKEREKVRALIREGKDPVAERRTARAAAAVASLSTFRVVAEAWLTLRKGDWSPIHYEKSRRALERDVYPAIGNLPMKDISSPMVAGVVEKITARGTRETAGKILQHIGAVFRYALAKGLCDINPADPVREILPNRKRTGRMAAILDFTGLGEILRSAEKARLSPAVRIAHRLTAFTAGRISNIVQAKWTEFDLEAKNPEWLIPRAKMKSKDRFHDHRVILSPIIAAEIREWRELIGPDGWVFQSLVHGRHISRESLEKCYRVTLGLEGKHSPHGWRAAFDTLAREEGGFDAEVVKLALDHVHDNQVARSYDRGERLKERVRLMNWWGEQLVDAQSRRDTNH